jgi:anti-sigma B factor antagonist
VAAIELAVDITSNGPWTVIGVAGEIDLFTAPKLREQFLAALDQEGANAQLVVDLSRVTFMDSTGLGALLELRSSLAERGRTLELAAGPGPVRLLFEVTGLDAKLPLHASAAAALRPSSG